MRIYTRRGDGGDTDLFGGARASKHAPRVEAIGAVDEVNAALGLVLANVGELEIGLLRSIQNDLFRLGAELASAPDSPPEKLAQRMTLLASERITELEQAIDRFEAFLPPLRNFILPGGSEPAARLQLARALCRRAERRMVSLAQTEPVRAEVLQYLNRLSDLLFVLARVANCRAGVEDVAWRP